MSALSDTSLPVYLIGETPLAYLLGAKLVLSGIKVIKITSLRQSSEKILLQQGAHLHKQNILLPCDLMMHQPAKLVLLCLNRDDDTNSLLYLAKNKTADTPIICFASSDTLELSNRLKQSLIPAYFDGWANFKEGILTYLGCRQGISLSINENDIRYETIRDIFTTSGIKFCTQENDTLNFWKNFIPYAAGSLFSLQNGNRFKELAKNIELRQKINIFANELLHLAPLDEEIDKEKMFTDIYTTPAKFAFPLASEDKKEQAREMLFFLRILQAQPSFKMRFCPETLNLLKETAQKHISPVEE